MYFFPGFWKVWRTGFDWVSAENLRNHMFLKWREFGDWTPPIRIDGVPSLLWAAAIGTVAFELGFLLLALSSRLRWLAIVAGLLFHNFTWILLRIHFWTLQASYAAFVDWTALVRRRSSAVVPFTVFPRAAALVGVVVVVGAVGTGARIIPLSWPFTVYPTFASLAGTTRVDLGVRVIDGSGRERSLDVRALNASAPGGFQPERLQGQLDRILAERDPDVQQRRLRALWSVLTRRDPVLRGASVVRFFRDTNATDRERRRENPLERELLFELYAAESSAS